MAGTYPPPLDKLLAFGDPREFHKWPNYLDLGFVHEHIPRLIHMATDPDFIRANSESLDVWAPVHAWRTLGQLHAAPAVEPLITLWKQAGEDEGADDWLLDDMPRALAMIGASAIPALETYLLDAENQKGSRTAAAYALRLMGEQQSDLRDHIVPILTAALARFRDNDEFLNGSLAADLVDLKAVESAAVIKAAYYARAVDLLVQGQWSDVAKELDLDPASVPGPEPAPEDMDAAWEKVLGMPRSRMLETFNRAFGDDSLASFRNLASSEQTPFRGGEKASRIGSSFDRSSSVFEPVSSKPRNQSARKAKSKRRQEKKSRQQNRKHR